MADLIQFPGCKFTAATDDTTEEDQATEELKAALLDGLEQVREAIEAGKTTAFWCIELHGPFAMRMPTVQSVGRVTVQELLSTAEMFDMYARARFVEQIEEQLG